jgi:hypothetical protein
MRIRAFCCTETTVHADSAAIGHLAGQLTVILVIGSRESSADFLTQLTITCLQFA